MTRRILPALLLLLAPSCHVSRPRLVVVIAVDQMRGDFLTRFGDQYESGLRHLVERGAVFANAHVSHAGTLTAPGMATISTGAHPSRTGIVDNAWWNRKSRSIEEAGHDGFTSVAGEPDHEGCSPAQIRREGLSAWLRGASPTSKVFSVALKDRSSVMLGGRHATAAYWMHPRLGRFVTSTYYLQDDPAWVDRFNESSRIETELNRTWELLKPEEAYARSSEDDFPYESAGEHPTFPHGRADGDAVVLSALMRTPFGDSLALEFAREIVVQEALGADAAPDLLWISLSAADRIGHIYGPDSREIHDYYLRLDRMLGDLLALLDSRVGRDRYVLALVSDHGVCPMVQYLQRQGVHAAVIVEDDLEAVAVQAIAAAAAGLDLQVKAGPIDGSGMVVEFAGRPAPDAVRSFWPRLRESLREVDYIGDVFTRDELLDPETPDRPYLEMFRRSFDAERSPDVLFLFPEHHTVCDGPVCVAHGTPYEYDTHVPIVFFGAGVRPGNCDSPAALVDIAPTLAVLLGLGVPPGVDGSPLEEALLR
jgi:predicted AlkP superfamily pyrophosphatase or phosphodiesterase